MQQSQASSRGMITHATQTSPSIPTNLNGPAVASQTKQGFATTHSAPQKQTASQTAPPKKNRRRTGKEYLIAARQRRQQQEYQNYHHPPSPEDIWICEFCEYERIFGTPPEALIKQYEIKDRRVRKQEAERRRLLEKAKMKGRKGKKGSKGVAPKTASGLHDRQAQHQQAQPPAPMSHSQSQSQGTQSEEYYEDEFDDEYVQDDPPPPSPSAPPATRQNENIRPTSGKNTVHGGSSTGDQFVS
jgi:hypothetical protein